jgi:hypothetical protein
MKGMQLVVFVKKVENYLVFCEAGNRWIIVMTFDIYLTN